MELNESVVPSALHEGAFSWPPSPSVTRRGCVPPVETGSPALPVSQIPDRSPSAAKATSRPSGENAGPYSLPGQSVNRSESPSSTPVTQTS